jgi:hypothetical protein
MPQQKDELINKIISEVKDEKLRNELLREVTKTDSSSGLGDTLSQLGIDPAGAKAYTGFQLKAGIVVSYFIGTLFTIGGLIGVIVIANMSTPIAALFPAIFMIAGIFSIISANKMRNAIKVQ